MLVVYGLPLASVSVEDTFDLLTVICNKFYMHILHLESKLKKKKKTTEKHTDNYRFQIMFTFVMRLEFDMQLQ